jgi:D-arabinose 1-dehydrogenase-like Zn-dependent alcohol dehydrogenase
MTGKSMRAVLIREFGAPLETAEVAVPEPRPGEVLIRVRAAGICATDVKLAAGQIPPPPPLPHIPGHEIAGEVASGDSDLKQGQRVACHIVDACNECLDCRRGLPILCAEAQRLGLDVPGGMAEYVAVPRGQVLPIDDAIPFEHAAVAMDSITSPWHALHVTGSVRPGEFLAVVGVGGLGGAAVQLAVAGGARVAAIDLSPERREEALRLGAEIAPDPAEAVAAIGDWSGGGADMAMELSGARAGFDVAAACLRGGGRVVCCGYAPGVEYGMDSVRLVLENISILGSRNLTLDDSRSALAALARGDVTPQIADRIGLDGVNDALDRLRAGRANGRIVITL